MAAHTLRVMLFVAWLHEGALVGTCSMAWLRAGALDVMRWCSSHVGAMHAVDAQGCAPRAEAASEVAR
eukprot:14028792-Alexandrium_andersonii.AAC.1